MRGDAEEMHDICDVFCDVLHGAAREIAASEVTSYRRRFAAQMRMEQDDVADRVGWLMRSVMYDGAPVPRAERLEVYQSLTGEEIAAAGARVLARDAALLSSGPMRQMPRFAAIRKMLAGPAKVKRLRLFG